METQVEVLVGGEVVVTADEINHAHKMCQQGQQNAVEWAIECGRLLIAKKGQLDHGEFEPWIQEHCHFKKTAAWNYMKVAEKVQTSELLAQPASIAGALRQIAAADPKPKPAPAPVREVAFSWPKHEIVMMGEEGEKAIDAEIAALSGASRDHQNKKINFADVGFVNAVDATMCVRIGELHPEDRRTYYNRQDSRTDGRRNVKGKAAREHAGPGSESRRPNRGHIRGLQKGLRGSRSPGGRTQGRAGRRGARRRTQRLQIAGLWEAARFLRQAPPRGPGRSRSTGAGDQGRLLERVPTAE